jgi:hypothetical protein
MPKAIPTHTTSSRRGLLATARPLCLPVLLLPPWPVPRRCRLLAVSSLPCSDVNHRTT